MWKELKPSEWFIEIEEGLDYRRKYGLEDAWHDLEALFYNVHPSQTNNPSPNIILSTGDSLLSTLSVPYPTFSVQAEQEETLDKSRVLETLDNNFVEMLKLPGAVEDSCHAAFLWGVGIVKVGYDSEFGYDPTYDMGRMFDSPMGTSLTQLDRKGWRIEFNDVKPGMPWAASVLPHDFVVPWGTKALSSAPWAVHRVVRHIDDVMEDVKYENKKMLKPVMSMRDFTKSYESTMKPYRLGETVKMGGGEGMEDAEYCELWEIHDRRTGKVLTVATGHDKFLRNEEDNLAIAGLPFVDLRFIPRSKSFWVTPDAYYLLQAQSELTDISIQATKQRRINVAKFMYNRKLISAEEMQKALSADVGAGVPVDDLMGEVPLNQVVVPFPVSANNLIYQEEEHVRRNAREAVGFSRNQAGEYESTGRRTAHEASIVDRASQQRMNRRQIGVRDTYLDVIKKVNEIVFKFWTTPRVAQLLDEKNVRHWVKYTGSGLRGDYSYKLSFSNDPPLSSTARKQLAMQMYQALVADPTVDQLALRRYLSRAFNDVEFGSIFKPGVLDGIMPVEGAEGDGGQGQAGVGPVNRGASQGLSPQGGYG